MGTSLPEFAVSLLAALRRQADVAVGNILGSNLFNLLGILGISALLLLLVLYTGHRISRPEGALLVLGYTA